MDKLKFVYTSDCVPVIRAEPLEQVETFGVVTERSSDGFGSTGR